MNRVIRASEIGEYVYCQRAWWLHRVCGFESANRAEMQMGVTRHAQHGRAVQRGILLTRAALALAALAILLVLLSAISPS